ncbi:MAG TPA: Mur ligase domain-containing protein [Patescibacteria group bacterium]|nr:Mur ligase domain-containing protein [Patescibacteria group bacterium]
MHVYFSGIGGSGMSSFALLGKQAGFEISGSDKQDGSYIHYLKDHGVTAIDFDQSYDHIAKVHAEHPIDWFVYSSAVSMEQADPPEIQFCKEHGIRISKRDEFLNMLLEEKKQKLVAIAGTHGKSTTTAMVVWLCRELGLDVSYSLGAKVGFGPLSVFHPAAEYFVYECDEFDRNFLAFNPYLSAITGLSWDHHEIFPTRENYNEAFRTFISQSEHTIAWQRDLEYLNMQPGDALTVLDPDEPHVGQLTLDGKFNREDGWLAIQAVHSFHDAPVEKLEEIMNRFPGLKQRMELLAPNLYTNYAHTPEKIRGGMSAALEIAKKNGQKLVIIYEPLTNRRQHYIKDDYKDCFAGAEKVYWIPSYLAREDPDLPLLTPEDLIPYLSDPSIAEPAKLDDSLLTQVREHLANGDLVVAMGASGNGSLDDWLREHFQS